MVTACRLVLRRSDLGGRLCQVPEWGGEQHHSAWEAGPEWRHDPSPLPLFHQLLTQHVPHRYARPGWMLPPADCMCSSFILAWTDHLFIQKYSIVGTEYIRPAGQSVKCTGAYETPRPHLTPSLCYPLSNQVVPWDSSHWYSWIKYFFRLVVTVTGSWQCTSMAGTIQRLFSL